ncbi:hypothetical protein M6B38_364770 [Iris pallida]|uniref:Uncharacterized protein n=1 Tax=Iris pallida TaxID=29817 RepID=A0AAX6GH81_IRIPA|nr:hypothetical protein M6B38_364770 [Iris pallida]
MYGTPYYCIFGALTSCNCYYLLEIEKIGLFMTIRD